MAGPGWEAFFLHTEQPLEELRRFLSPAFVRMKSAAGTQEKPTHTLDHLERLAALKAQGALTEAEFAEAKRKVLGL